MKACKQTNWQTIIDILLTNGLLIYLLTCFLPKTKDKDLEIFKIQLDDIILPWVADGVTMYWWVPMC